MKLFIDNLPFDLYARSIQEYADQTPCEWVLISSAKHPHDNGMQSLSIEQIHILEKLLGEISQRLKNLKSKKIAYTHTQAIRNFLTDTQKLESKGAANE